MQTALIVSGFLVAYIVFVTLMVRWLAKRIKQQENTPKTGKPRYSKSKELRNN